MRIYKLSEKALRKTAGIRNDFGVVNTSLRFVFTSPKQTIVYESGTGRIVRTNFFKSKDSFLSWCKNENLPPSISQFMESKQGIESPAPDK